MSQIDQAPKTELIEFISAHSSRYGDKLVDFMQTYDLYNLQQATVSQLREYIHAHDFTRKEPELTL